jgi:SAM-dependent methyltransferase
VSPQIDEVEYWNRVAPIYASLYERDWSRYEDAVLRADLEKTVSTPNVKRILDIGCGTGLAYELIRDLTPSLEYIGFDVSREMLVEFARRFPDVTLIEGTADALLDYFSPSSFDVVIATNVAASFWAETSRVLKLIFSVLAPGGRFHLSFLNRLALRRIVRGLYHRREQYRTRGDPEMRQYVWAQSFSRRELIRLFQKAGFVGLEGSYRSVLGGVWETRASIMVERTAVSILPWLGHSITITGQRPRM